MPEPFPFIMCHKQSSFCTRTQSLPLKQHCCMPTQCMRLTFSTSLPNPLCPTQSSDLTHSLFYHAFQIVQQRSRGDNHDFSIANSGHVAGFVLVCDIGLPEFFAQVLELVLRKALLIYQRFEVDDFFAILDPCDPKLLWGLPDENANIILSWYKFERIFGFVCQFFKRGTYGF